MTKFDLLEYLQKHKGNGATPVQMTKEKGWRQSNIGYILERMRLYGLVNREILRENRRGRNTHIYKITKSGLNRLIWYKNQHIEGIKYAANPKEKDGDK